MEQLDVQPQNWFKDTERNRMIRVALLDSLQLKMKKDKDSIVKSDVKILEWDIVGYSEDFIWLQIEFENPEDIGAFDSMDLIEVTFWGT